MADPAKFPSGIKALADYIHSKGLRFGIYTASSSVVCSGRPGSLFHEALDAQTFVSWDVDYVKIECVARLLPIKAPPCTPPPP